MLPFLVIGAVTAGVVGKKIFNGLFGSSSSNLNQPDQLKPAPPVLTQPKPARRFVATQPNPPRQPAFKQPKRAAFIPPKPPPPPRINPATGLPMVGGVDVRGNPYGARLR